MGRKMRWLLLTLIALNSGLAFADGSGSGVGIVHVLHRSQHSRLDAMPPAGTNSARALQVRDSFDALVAALRIPVSVALRVVQGDVVAETILGNVVVANETLGALAEDERRFILAHELGHVVLGHWRQVEVLYEKWIPGAVTPERTDAIAADLGREASALAYQHEFDADGYALRALRLLGHSPQAATSAFLALGAHRDTITHPGTLKRVAALRLIETAADAEP
jgi:Zn-dependent protease with chaperone function